jgi:predicted transposase YbfD/YdcC
LPLAGAVVTADALHTQAATVRFLVTEKHADYVFTVKENQPTLQQDIAALRLDAFPPQHTDLHKAHGRLETRAIWTSTALTGYLGFPHVAQVFCLRRTTTVLATGATRTETVCGLINLPPVQASPARLLALVRAHWTIEKRLHRVRDVTFDEDRSQIRRGAGPKVMARSEPTQSRWRGLSPAQW